MKTLFASQWVSGSGWLNGDFIVNSTMTLLCNLYILRAISFFDTQVRSCCGANEHNTHFFPFAYIWYHSYSNRPRAVMIDDSVLGARFYGCVPSVIRKEDGSYRIFKMRIFTLSNVMANREELKRIKNQLVRKSWGWIWEFGEILACTSAVWAEMGTSKNETTRWEDRHYK